VTSDQKAHPVHGDRCRACGGVPSGSGDVRSIRIPPVHEHQLVPHDHQARFLDWADPRAAGFRAGSGESTNECYVGHGWLPAGWYNLVGHFDSYNGSSIKGRVWQLSDKRCSGGTGNLRTQLFIHSEETADTGQYCPTPGDDPFCWEGASDYYSVGCIKLAHATPYPSDIGKADNDWDSWDGRHGYFTVGNVLNVN